jgi:hypothetical protein
MNSSLPLYALGGALSFCVLSAIATKYRGEEINSRNLIRDTTAGALFTAFILVLVPDMFPPISMSSAIGLSASAITSAIKMSGGSSTSAESSSSNTYNGTMKVDDFDLQVGYPGKRK